MRAVVADSLPEVIKGFYSIHAIAPDRTAPSSWSRQEGHDVAYRALSLPTVGSRRSIAPSAILARLGLPIAVSAASTHVRLGTRLAPRHCAGSHRLGRCLSLGTCCLW